MLYVVINDIQHKDTQQIRLICDSQHNDIQHNATQHKSN
jgi:hypothetical protein